MFEIRSVQRYRDLALENKQITQTNMLFRPGFVLYNLEWFSDPIRTPTASYRNITD